VEEKVDIEPCEGEIVLDEITEKEIPKVPKNENVQQ
jgi:hypothetical protein